ncbi:hypothetical protein GYMLUDRAFT_75661 [Collybiopsis luxurians FD-317 M1]|uniref:Thioredoxin domain-containing protein n=1 Tax=Collybiopsis luxurians FD-317 M1 TaxID=944289 RepID=A0A0D0CPB9_9AGAR|nr:hypothetical protein GYMLUDRAFT_75661 [Collybiopsis luxurians FD-317 M1]
MSQPVKLYVYDLSNGMASQMSLQLTGRQIDGIWHTSIVVFGKEVFYGQGINITAPGRSHHGTPLRIVDIGTTDIDEETFNEYLAEMREHYTADKVRSINNSLFPSPYRSFLPDFNCNSFTNDCAGFLTGGSIPDYIKDLPSDFLSTPFGAALRPTIDSMYRRPGTTPPQLPTPAATPNPELAGSILQSVASQAQQGMHPPTPLQATESLVAPFHPITNSASFQSLLRTHKAVVINFSDLVTCPPCRVIAPVYEDLARAKGVKTSGGAGAAFAKIDLNTPSGKTLGAEWNVRVMPTFMFFLDGKKISEMKGADANELRSQIDLLLFQAYPPHPHTSLSLPSIQSLSLNPILFTQVPALDTVANKLVSFIDSAPWPSTCTQSKSDIKHVLSTAVLPYLKSRSKTPSPPPSSGTATPAMLVSWSKATQTLAQVLPMEQLFPLVDMWRLALLDGAVGTWCAAKLQLQSASSNVDADRTPIDVFLGKAKVKGADSIPRAYHLTLLRLLSNAYASPVLAPYLLLPERKGGGGGGGGGIRDKMTEVMVRSLLNEDAGVRMAAASLVFNGAAWVQKGRVEAVRSGGGVEGKRDVEDEDWEVEMVSAVVEAVDREKGSEDVVHRLTASLGCLLRLSPFYESQIKSLLEVLQAKRVLRSKLGKGGCGEEGVRKGEVRRLVEEVADRLC